MVSPDSRGAKGGYEGGGGEGGGEGGGLGGGGDGGGGEGGGGEGGGAGGGEGGDDGGDGGGWHTRSPRPATKEEPPDVGLPPHSGLKLKPLSRYCETDEPSHDLYEVGQRLAPESSFVSTITASSYS